MQRLVDIFELAKRLAKEQTKQQTKQQTKSDAGLSGELSLSGFARFCQGLPEQTGVVQWRLQAESNAAGQVFLTVEAQATAVLECQRCLSLFEQPLQVANRLEVVRGDDALEGDDAPGAVERIVGSSRFDLLALIEDELILVLPYVPRHSVCPPQPGQTQEPAQEQQDQAQPLKRPSPFAALAGLKKPSAQ